MLVLLSSTQNLFLRPDRTCKTIIAQSPVVGN